MIKSKRNFSLIFTEISKDNDQSISAHKIVLLVYSDSKISLDNSLKEQINSLLKTENPYSYIIQRIEEGTSELLVRDFEDKIRGTMLWHITKINQKKVNTSKW